MPYLPQVQSALQEVSRGTGALSCAVRASLSLPNIGFDAFAYRAVTAPLARLAFVLDAVNLDLPSAKPTAQRVRRQPPKRRRITTQRAQNKIPPPPDLGAFAHKLHASALAARTEVNPVSEASACRAVLLEIVRRAAYDWVLYRNSSKLQKRQLADSAYQWLFIEERDSSTWRQRVGNGKELTAFIAICEVLELDPRMVRTTVRGMTVAGIMSAGRPAERRKAKPGDEQSNVDDLNVFDVDVDNLPSYDNLLSSDG